MDAVRHAGPSLVIHAAYAHDRAAIARDEASQPDAVWDYGRWKAEAERIAARTSDTATIIRLSLLVSIDPDDHVVREIRICAARGETTKWFTDETRQPAPAHEVAVESTSDRTRPHQSRCHARGHRPPARHCVHRYPGPGRTRLASVAGAALTAPASRPVTI
jgi:hypothetical protein